MREKDIRWVQRYNHFCKALSQLQEAVELANKRQLTRLEEQGMIQAFEFTHELAWKTFKDFLENRGVQDLYGSKDSTRHAFQSGLISNGDVWMDMVQSRNLTSHTYDETIAAQIVAAIRQSYYTELETLRKKLASLVDPKVT